MKSYIANCAVYIIEMLISFMYFSDIFAKKRNIKSIISVGILIYFSASLINIVFKNNAVLNTTVFLLANLMFSLICFDISFKKSVLNSIIITSSMTVSESVVIFIVSALLNNEVNVYQNNFSVYLIEAILSKTIYLLVCKLLTRLKVISTKKPKDNTPIYLFIYPVCTAAILILFGKLSLDYNISSELNTCVSIVSFILLFSIIITYILYGNTVKKDNELFELKNELSRIEVDESYYLILEHQNEEMHTFAHDTKNHLSTIKYLADDEQVDEYIDKIYSDLNKYSASGKTDNKILDIILNKYSVLCEINKIEFYTVVKTANLNYISSSDLSSLLNNMLDNALEAARKSKGKRIELSINRAQSFDVLTCTNSCDVRPEAENHILKTTKEDKRFHGYGTKSMRKIVKKYNGTYKWDYNESAREFTTSIIFESQ